MCILVFSVLTGVAKSKNCGDRTSGIQNANIPHIVPSYERL